MKRYEICIHTVHGDDLTIEAGADTLSELLDEVEKRIYEADVNEFIRFGQYLVRHSTINWVWITPKPEGGTTE